MTAPVIEVLGSAYDCNPLFFAHHMYTTGARKEEYIGHDGKPTKPLKPELYPSEPHSTAHPDVYTPSEKGAFPFFSLPFRRTLGHNLGPEIIESIQQKRSMFRQLHTIRSFAQLGMLEERVSGTILPVVPISDTKSTHTSGYCYLTHQEPVLQILDGHYIGHYLIDPQYVALCST
ncbi:hypothetical protein N656DRAFT_243349 [Canariomyces notabilis]|uniref:Uncharacterized protein n=1 Tax=Canariomyces notabilis TaxID=2074819 RepID=A0AAN6YW88_9PEZI|nr:hypothetical protein N656DRAFT_243349 [Canariomyces arenarius]